MHERSVFLAALDIADPGRRAAYLREACGNDAELQRSVEALLATSDAASAFLNTPAAAPDAARADTNTDTSVPLDFLTPCDVPASIGRLGSYVVTRVIGQGGMGIVLEGRDTRLDRVVAIKVLSPHLAASAIARQRFLREAKAAAAVRDEHVVTIYAVEEVERTPYLVMELIAGLSLQERLDRDGPLAQNEVLRIAIQTARGLAAAHAQGLVHRDVKPANILLENGVERVKLTDFGLARVASDENLTQTRMIAGTPSYMSPEQARGESVDHRADLFSLGSVLYAMCTGRPPFRAETTIGVIRRVCDEPPRAIRELNPETPDWLVALIDRLHAKQPAERFQSAAEVADVLSEHLAQLQQSGRKDLVERRAGGVSLPIGQMPQGTDVPRLPSRRWTLAAAVLVCLFASLGLTEATGVTQVVPTVIRILTGEGTLVVEVNDPGVKVEVEGDGGLVITGAGPHEVRLKPGSYKLQATKDGQPAHTEMVTILNGQRKVVTVTLEPKGPPPAADENRPLLGHTATVCNVAFTPDGRRIVSASHDGTVRVWDRASRLEIARFEGHKLSVYGLAISPDGTRVLSGSGPPPHREHDTWSWSLCLWELATGRELNRLTGQTDGQADGIASIAFSADGRRALVGDASGQVILWDVAAWREIKRLSTKRGLWSVEFSPDESRVLTAAGDTGDGDPHSLRLWDLASGKELHQFAGHAKGMWLAVFSPSGDQIASACGDHTIRLWNSQTGALVHEFRAPDVATGAAYSADGKYLLTGAYGIGKTVQLWHLESKREVASFTGHTNGVQSVAMSPDGRWAVSGSIDRAVRLWALPAEVHQNMP